ncbi:sterol desaturase family protein [Cupriavidus sp. WKF15]|uniref:sterol desaturase family protein n=1 Tax=Cupriavidus sp. WKF15 TaxID=3032282 RepID=UPI0023E28488|nr:sterol desaturase family protein [Cupriavidus sp. WKF15]WER47058.1 sterol desaturase family protein [Cupriavidus sp. WKF15]
MDKIIVYALPLFFVLMACEFAYGLARRKNTYRLSDSLSSLSQGLLSQLAAGITQLFQIGLYTLVFRRVALFAGSPIWHAWYGWLIAIVLFDFCDYWLHRMGHESAVMWAAHAVHHQSQHFNLSTALRQESTVALLGWPFYLPMAVLGVAPEQFALAGLIVLLYQFWIHTEHIGKLGWFDRVFSSPSNHRVHHAVNDQYLDKNYGGMLVIWDRLFGTFAEEREPCVYGTRTQLRNWNPLWAVAVGYSDIAKLARRTRRWSDKLRLWFKPPGWLPEDLKAAASTVPYDLQAAAQRYDPQLSRGRRWFAAAQFLQLMAATGSYLWFADDLSFGQTVLVVAPMVAGLWSLGMLLEGRLKIAQICRVNLASAGAALAIWLSLYPR